MGSRDRTAKATRLREPRDFAAATEVAAVPPGAFAERFLGYGVMGLPFHSGHVLAVRRFPATSLSEPYTSVWHRSPSGRWTFRQDVPADRACSRYFDAELDRTIRTDIVLAWTGPRTLEVMAEGLQWRVELAATPVTRTMNAVSTRLPARAWQNPRVLGALGAVAAAGLRTGRVGLQGTAPNGQRFQSHPLRVWIVTSGTAIVDGEDLGDPGPLSEQDRLGDLWMPQRGVFAVGRASFEGFDPDRHVATRSAVS